MMKRARVATEMSMIQRGAGAARVVPRGPCWILEGSHWVSLIWHEDGERQLADVSMRDYVALVENGSIQFSTLEEEWSDSTMEARRREIPTRVSALSSRLAQ